MNRLYTLIAAIALPFCCFGTASAQDIYLCKGGDYTVKTITEGAEIDLTQGYDSITFSKPQIAPVVSIAYSASTATVSMPSFLTGVTASVDGANVTITSTNTTDEVTYVTSGTSTNGSLTINGSYKLTLVLDGLDLVSTKGSAIDIQCGKRTALVLKPGTINKITDTAGGTQKACLYCKGHLEVEGAGTLDITSNTSHAISTKEYLQLKKSTGTINIVGSANDALHVSQYFLMSGGTVNINDNTVGDGIQVDKTSDATDENNGQVIIKGGTLNIAVTSEDTKAIKAEGDIAISGGTYVINAKGNGTRGIQTDADMTISDSNNATSITITAAGGKCTQPECVDDPHKCMGIKVDGNLTITGGTTTVYNTGKKSKGIKVGGVYNNTGGTVDAEMDI